MTELSPVALSTRDEIMVPGSCGVLISNTEGKIVDVKTGKNVGPNEVGELCIRGPQVSLLHNNVEYIVLHLNEYFDQPIIFVELFIHLT